jgi:hypothetical protein
MRIILALPTLLLVSLPPAAHAALPPAGSSFKLHITTSFEDPFNDCWTFSTNGRFIHSASLKNFPYQLTGLNKTPDHFQAIWVGHVSIAFSGAVTGSTLSGDAVDALARTFSIAGTAVSSCGEAASVLAHGGWHARP